MTSKKVKNPIDKFIYSIRDGFKNIKKAFMESEVIHKAVSKIIPVSSNEYGRAISGYALKIIDLLETQDVSSSDKKFNIYYSFIKNVRPNIDNTTLIFGYVFNLINEATGKSSPKRTNIEKTNWTINLLKKSDYDLTNKEKAILKRVLNSIKELYSNITIDE